MAVIAGPTYSVGPAPNGPGEVIPGMVSLPAGMPSTRILPSPPSPG